MSKELTPQGRVDEATAAIKEICQKYNISLTPRFNTVVQVTANSEATSTQDPLIITP